MKKDQHFLSDESIVMRGCRNRAELEKYISIILITLINCIFAYKYLVKFSSYTILVDIYNWSSLKFFIDLIKSNPLLSTVIYGIGFFLFAIMIDKYIAKLKQLKLSLLFLIGIFVYLFLNLAAILATDPKSITVDRWSTIMSFWDAVNNGTFPYLAKSHLGCLPGPSPFYFVIAYPFYLIGEIGYLSLTGCLLLFVLIFTHYNNITNKYMAIALLILSTTVFWENLARSTVLTMSVIILVYMVMLINNKKTGTVALVLWGAAGGLLFSTRSVYIITYIVCYEFLFLQTRKHRELAVVSISFVIAYAFTFLPFIIWDLNTFIRYNPITLQASLASHSAIILVLLLSVVAGLYVKTEQDVYFSTAILILLVVSSHMVMGINSYGFDEALFGNKADISYLVLALPFLSLSMPKDMLPIGIIKAESYISIGN